MSWFDRHLEASFRGIKFFVRKSPSKFGRNKIVHEFPFSNKPVVEDVGKLTQRFPIDGFLIGDDYDLTRDQLIKASEKKGPGQLIHPYLGIKSVECLQFEIDESFNEGGFARIKFEFIEAGTKTGLFGFVDDILELIDEANDFIDNAILEFNEVFSVLSAPAFVVQSAAGLVDKAGDFILSKNGLGAVEASVSDLTSAVNSLKSESLQLVRAPEKLARKTLESINALGKSFSSIEDGTSATIDVSKYRPTPSPQFFNTRNRRLETRNQASYIRLLRSSVLTSSTSQLCQFLQSQATLTVPTSSIDEVMELRNRILSILDELLAGAGSLASYRSLQKLRTKLLRAIPGATELPQTQIFKLDRNMSVYQLSYKLYGSTRQVPNLISRNSIANPSLIPINSEIEYVK